MSVKCDFRAHRAVSHCPSPFTGEAGRERSERPGEGSREPPPPRTTSPPRPSPAALRAATSPARGEGFCGAHFTLIAQSPTAPLPSRERPTVSAASGRVRVRGSHRRRGQPHRPGPHPPRFARRPLPQGERGLACASRSSRDLPGGAVFGVFQHDAHLGEFIADAIGSLEVLALRAADLFSINAATVASSTCFRIVLCEINLRNIDTKKSTIRTDRSRRQGPFLASIKKLMKLGNRLRSVQIIL